MPRYNEQSHNKGLNHRQMAFCREYITDHNATRATVAAGYNTKQPKLIGYRLLQKPAIQEYIQELRDERARRLDIKNDDVLERWWKLANSDVRDLMNYRIDSCRYCNGAHHKYQWIDEDEYEEARQHAAQQEPPLPEPSDAGGYGYHPDTAPAPDCPRCFGRGIQQVMITDTRSLTDDQARLFAGIKQTKDGLEIKTEDRMKALENVARHLGMFKQEHSHTVPEGSLAALMVAMGGKEGGSTFGPGDDVDS